MVTEFISASKLSNLDKEYVIVSRGKRTPYLTAIDNGAIVRVVTNEGRLFFNSNEDVEVEWVT